MSTGSGFLVNDSGWILTNAHVIEGCDVVRIATLGDAVSVVTDSEADLALVRFGGAFDGRPLPLRDTQPRLAEPVVALGFPLSDILGSDIRATTGTVSSLSGVQGDPRFIQISAPLQSGNSGGPVLDAAGNVIGIATSQLKDRGENDYQNVNFAVTAREAVRFAAANGLSLRPPGDAEGNTIEAAAQSTVLLQCLADTSRPPDAPAPNAPEGAQATARASGMVSYSGMDVLGLDYRTLSDVSLFGCQAICEADALCRAYTYNTRHAACFLKSDAMVLVENGDAVGGYDADLADDVVDSGLRIASDVDSPGGDFARLKNMDFVGCTLACGIDPGCMAFAFVRDTGSCWLKSTLGPLEAMPGVEFGVRR